VKAGARNQESGIGGQDSGVGQGRLLRRKPRNGWSYRWRWLNVALAVTTVGLAHGLGAQTTVPRPGRVVTVRVYNYANASLRTLGLAESEAGRIIGTTGVAATWLDCLAPRDQLQPVSQQAGRDCSGPVSGATVVLRILPRSTPANTAFRDTMFGYADGSALASVFYGRIERFARDLDTDATEIPVILGHAMAHEIGHLLLGSASHSKTGIMCGQWDRNYLRRALTGRLVFSPEQVERIQAEVLKRIQALEVAAKSSEAQEIETKSRRGASEP
jgi:hypothetical protein